MLLEDFVVPLLILLAMAFVFTQMLLPTLRGGHWFPMFRSKRRTLLEQLEEAHDVQEDKELEEQLKHIKGEDKDAQYTDAKVNANTADDGISDSKTGTSDNRTSTSRRSRVKPD